LEKETIRKNLSEFVASNVNRRFVIKGSTSGSTGTPLSLYMDRRLIQREYAFVKRQFRWAGCPPNGRVAVFRGDLIVPFEQKRPPYWRYDVFSRELWFSSYHLSEETAKIFAEKLVAFSPHLIYCFPSTLFSLACYLLEKGTFLKIPNLKGIVTSSETLYENQKHIIEKILGVPIYDWYGGFERVIFIGTCEFGTYHVFSDYGITEFIPLAKIDDDIHYELVGTGFLNEVMPLVRYRTGDTVTLKENACECGRAFPIVGKIYGRMDDYIFTPEGRPIGLFFTFVFKDIKNIRSAQIIQESIDSLTVLIVPTSDYSLEDEAKINKKIRERLGNKIWIKIHQVSEIPPMSNGKFKAVVSKVNGFSSLINDQIERPS
jgi:phenylacetate-CoA ligase